MGGSGTKGLPLPDPVDPGSYVEYHICVPNAWQYRSALVGAISELCKYWTWEHTEDDISAAQEAAFLFKDALNAASYEEACMTFCERMIECLTSDEDVQAALATLIASNPTVQDAIAAAIADSDTIRRALEIAPGLGAPMGPAQLNAPINTDSGCDLDVVFAEITGIVDQLDTNNRDFLEIMAVASTPGKRLAQVIAAIPALETLPVDDIVAYVAKLYDEIVANYNAAWTTAVRDEYRCDLFCLARDKPDCQLDYDDLFEYFNQRLGNAVSIGNLVGSVVQYTILGTWSGTVVIDIMMLNQIAIWRAAGNWLGLNLRSLQAVTQLSGNIPDSDWMTLCDCVEAPVWSLTSEPASGFPPSYYGVIDSQTSNSLSMTAVNASGPYYRAMIQATHPVTLANVIYSPVTYVVDPGGYPDSLHKAANGLTTDLIFMASLSPFTLSFEWT